MFAMVTYEISEHTPREREHDFIYSCVINQTDCNETSTITLTFIYFLLMMMMLVMILLLLLIFEYFDEKFSIKVLLAGESQTSTFII